MGGALGNMGGGLGNMGDGLGKAGPGHCSKTRKEIFSTCTSTGLWPLLVETPVGGWHPNTPAGGCCPLAGGLLAGWVLTGDEGREPTGLVGQA